VHERSGFGAAGLNGRRKDELPRGEKHHVLRVISGAVFELNAKG
jgi:hypothetical protein